MRGSDCQAGGVVVSFLFCSPDFIVWTKLASTNYNENTGFHFSFPLLLPLPLSILSPLSPPILKVSQIPLGKASQYSSK